MQPELNAVILAAGHGKRMKSNLPKVLHPLAGLPMIQHCLRAVAGVTDQLPVIVVGHRAEQVSASVGEKARFVLQEPQLGTAHALRMAEPLLESRPGLLLVINGDMPLLTSTIFQRLIKIQCTSSGPISMLTVIHEDPHGFGRVVRDAQGSVQAIVEEAQATEDILAIRELNASVYCFDSTWLWDALPRIPLSPKGEYYLTDVVSVAVSQGLKVQAMVAEDPNEVLGINTREHLAEAEAVLRQRINKAWMLSGVSIVDPQTTYIEADVQIAPETRILPCSSLFGSTVVGTECQIGPQAILINSRLGDRCEVIASVLENCELEDSQRVGPYAYLRGKHPAGLKSNQPKVI
jgi:bifunctional UDP-N-acetylglucosamine pyrophosphorylase/glucosamine-1-phosphate N-acetyltransferase